MSQDTIKIIKDVINDVLMLQPLETDKFRDYVEERLKLKLNTDAEYHFDEYGDWKRLRTFKVDDETYIDIYEIDDIDEVGINDEWFNVFIEGKIIEVSTPRTVEYIMIDCKVKDVKPQEDC